MKNFVLGLMLGLSALFVVYSFAGDFKLDQPAIIAAEQGDPQYVGFMIKRKAPVNDSLLEVEYELENAGSVSFKKFLASKTWGDLTAAQKTALLAIVKDIVCTDIAVRFPGRSCN